MKTPHIGRPTEIPDRRTMKLYLTSGELRQVARQAKLADVSASAWVRALVLAALAEGRTP